MADFENQDGESRLSLRDALMSAVEQHRDPTEETLAAKPAASAAIDDQAARARDEAGRFTKPDSTSSDSAAKPLVLQAPAGISASKTPDSAAPAAIMPVAPPSSWKKDHHEAFGKLDPTLQKYILQRETEFNTGVSTYKGEAESARSLKTALEPFMANMQRYNVDPANWITTVGRVHETLLAGSPQQKLQTIVGLARDYGVDLSPLAQHLQSQSGENGQQGAGSAQLNPEVAWLRDQVQQLSGQVNSFTQAQQQAQQRALQDQQTAIQNEIEQFSANTEKYPHFEVLREPMAGLLQSGLAQNLDDAYGKALRMNDDLWKAQQANQQAQAEADRKRAAAAAAAMARSKVVSVRSATPSSTAITTSTATDRRSQIAEAVASQSGSRV